MEEVVEQANEGDLLMVKRVLISFQIIEEEPKEDPFHTKEKAIILALDPLSNFPKKAPKRT